MRRRPTAQTVLLSSFVLALLSLPALASASIDNVSSGVSVSPPGTATLVVRVMNTGPIPDTFDVHALPPRGWSEVDLGSSLDLDPGSTETVLLVLRCPTGTLAGEYLVQIRAVSLTDPLASAEVSQTVAVQAVSGVELVVAVKDQGAPPGAWVTYPLTVYNRGNGGAEFELAVTSPAASNVEVVPAFLDIPPGGQAEAVARQAIASAALPGDLVRMSVIVTSRADPRVSDSAILTTEILPAPPDAVGGSLMQQLPSHVTFAVGGDVLSGMVSGSAGLSFGGTVEGGHFSVDLGVRSLFGPSPLDLDSVCVLYRRDASSFAVGDTSQHLTDLAGISCRGGMLEIAAENYGMVFIGGGRGSEARAGGRVVVGPEVLNAGVAYVDSRSAASADSIWSLSFAARPLDEVSLHLEAALGEHNNSASQGLLFGSQVDAGAFFVDVKVFSVDTGFPGARGDSAGVTVAQHLHLPELTVSGSFAHTWDDTDSSPLIERTISERLELDARGVPLPEGPDVQGKLELSWDHGEDPAWKDLVRLRLAFAAEGGVGVFPYSLSAECVDHSDRILGTSTRDLSLIAGCGIAFDGCSLGLTLTHCQARDLVTDTVTGGSTGLAFRFEFIGAPCSARLDLASAEEQYTAGLLLELRLDRGLEVAVGTTTRWSRDASADLEFGWSVSMDCPFDLPIPFIRDKGRLSGLVYVDENGNGQRDEGEPGLGGLVVVLDGRRALTGVDGRFRFPPLPPGAYTLRAAVVPRDYVSPTSDGMQLQLEAGKTIDVCLPVVRAGAVSGRIVVVPTPAQGESPSGLFLEGEGQADDVLAGITVTLESRDGEVLRTTSNAAGEFHFVRLCPGEWSLRLAADELPPFHTVQEETVAVPVAAGGEVDVVVRVFVESRPVEIIDGGTLY